MYYIYLYAQPSLFLKRLTRNLVNMAVKKYGHAKAISKVIEDLVNPRKGDPETILKMLEEIRRKVKLSNKINAVKLVKEAREERAREILGLKER